MNIGIPIINFKTKSSYIINHSVQSILHVILLPIHNCARTKRVPAEKTNMFDMYPHIL